MIPFCQSENYLGYLCGAPPDVGELLLATIAQRGGRERIESQSSSASEREATTGFAASSFSLTQFRHKLFSLIGGGGGGVSSQLLNNSGGNSLKVWRWNLKQKTDTCVKDEKAQRKCLSHFADFSRLACARNKNFIGVTLKRLIGFW